MGAIKVWTQHPDKVLSLLCKWLIDRNLFKCILTSEAFDMESIQLLKQKVQLEYGISGTDLDYFVFTGTACLSAYNINNEKINILFKNGTVKDISSIDNALISHTLAIPVKKFYICHPKI
jgi:hypothetical protein